MMREPTVRATSREAATHALPGAATGLICLLLVTAAWASVFPITKVLGAHVDASALTTARFTLSALLLLPFLAQAKGFAVWRDGLALGTLLFLNFALQTEGTMRGTATNAAFLASISVVLVPFLPGGRAGFHAWTAASLALVGAAALSLQSGRITGGDTLVLVSSVVYALYTVYLGRAARHPLLALASVQTLLIAVLAATWSLSTASFPTMTDFSGTSGALIVYLAVVVTGATVLLQPYAQRFVPARRALLVFSLEPFLAGLAGITWLGEPLTGRMLIGGLLIGAAVLIGQQTAGVLVPTWASWWSRKHVRSTQR